MTFTGRPQAADLFAPIDFKHVSEEMSRDRTMKLTILWEEYAIGAAETGRRPYQYSRFCEKYSTWCEANDISVIRRYTPGDIGELDWAGKKMALCDAEDGRAIEVPIFVACLPYSQYVFVRAYSSMKMDHWLQASSDAFTFFGGCPRIVTVDNLKSGVTKHVADEIVLNRTFREFAEHHNVAIIPHKPRYPRGKSSVESSVDKFANKIRLMLRNQKFFDIDELNAAIVEKVDELNSRSFQKRAGTRSEVFAEREKPCLQPLPALPWERAVWGAKVKVPKTYHVLCTPDRILYSVPHRCVGREVEVRTTAHVVEVYCEGERIAAHARERTRMPEDGPVTKPEHRPKRHADFLDHDSAWFRAEAAKTGPATTQVIEGFLRAGIAEEQGWGWCEKLLGKRRSHSARSIEDACSKATKVLSAPSYKAISLLIKNSEDGDDAQAGSKDSPWAIRRF